jgi:hypothetical protein
MKHWQRFTPAEEGFIRRSLLEGRGTCFIAMTLRRNERAVDQKIRRMDLSTRPAEPAHPMPPPEAPTVRSRESTSYAWVPAWGLPTTKRLMAGR